jgi:hypothetical protein
MTNFRSRIGMVTCACACAWILSGWNVNARVQAQDPVVLPAPTGSHPTGRTSFHWVDTSREELETSAAGDRRELMVHLFYPADGTAAGDPPPYVPDADAMRAAWNDAQMARLLTIRPYSRDKAIVSKGGERYPVLIFVPGGGMKALTYHALLEDLASHGWVVTAVDPPFNARAIRFPDGRVLGDLLPAERGWPQPRSPEDNQRVYRERVVHWSRDVSFVIDQLTALDRGPGPFAGRLDLRRGVGVFGHSRGGQAAATARILDTRVRGAVNLDGAFGAFAVMPVSAGDANLGSQPFLWIQKPLPSPPTEEQLQRGGRTRADFDAEIKTLLGSWARQLSGIAGGSLRVTFDRSTIRHVDFSDEPFWDGSMTSQNRPDRLQTIADTRAWVRAFFDGAVRGEWTDLDRLRAGAGERRTTVHTFGSLRAGRSQFPLGAPLVAARN